MTREEIKRRAELYSALAKGKIIQIKDMSGAWHDVEPEKLDCIPETIAFRIKPEAKYRPFKTKEECWQEMIKHQPFGWLKRDTYYQNIMAVDCSYIYIETLTTNFNYKEALDEFTFADGTPFGTKEE